MSEKQAIVRYSYRLRPGKTAERKLVSDWDCCRWVWNQYVEAGNEAFKAHKEEQEDLN